MNMRVTPPSPAALRLAPLARTGAGTARVAQAAVIPVAEGVAALTVDLGAGVRIGRGRIGGEVDGANFPRPVVCLKLGLRCGGIRLVVLIGRAAPALAGSACRIDLDGRTVAVVDPTWLQSPLREPLDLVQGLSDAGRSRLLKTFATTAASLFGGGRATGFGAALRGFAGLLGAREVRPATVCALGLSGRILSYVLPADTPEPEFSALMALSQDRVVRLAGFAAVCEMGPRGRILHVHAPHVAGADVLIGAGSAPLALGLGSEAMAPRPLVPWLRRRTPRTQAWVLERAVVAAPRDRGAAALVREIGCAGAPDPELRVRHLSRSGGGVLVLGDLSDPQGLIAGVRLETGGAAVDLVPVAGVVAGFAPLGGVERPGAVCRVRLVYGSGRMRSVGDWALADLGPEIPDGFAAIDPARAAHALAQARLQAPSPIRVPGPERIAPAVNRPVLSLVVEAGSRPDVLRARLAMLFAEPGMARVEVVHHAAAEEAAAVRRVLTEASAVFGIGATLVVVPREATPSQRLGAALGVVRGDAALVLGADVLPAEAGWLAVWTRALRARRGPVLLGGLVLTPEGAVGCAGGALVRRGEGLVADRRWAGLPLCELPPRARLPTATLGVQCLGMRGPAIAAFVAAADRYPSADVVLNACGHRLLADGARVETALRAPFRRYGAAEPPGGLGAEIEARALAALIAGDVSGEDA